MGLLEGLIGTVIEGVHIVVTSWLFRHLIVEVLLQRGHPLSSAFCIVSAIHLLNATLILYRLLLFALICSLIIN